MFHQHMRQTARRVATLAFAGAAALGLGPAGAGTVAAGHLPLPMPTVTDYQYLSGSTTPPGDFASLATPTPAPYVDPNAAERRKAAEATKDEKKAAEKKADADEESRKAAAKKADDSQAEL